MLSSRVLSAHLRALSTVHGRVIVCVRHDDSGSGMYGFAPVDSVQQWTSPEGGIYCYTPVPGAMEALPDEPLKWRKRGNWGIVPNPHAGQRFVVLGSSGGSSPDNEPGDDERALADPRVLEATAIADILDSLPDLPVAMWMGPPDETVETSSSGGVELVASEDELLPLARDRQFTPAGLRHAYAQPRREGSDDEPEGPDGWPVGDDRVEWPACLELFNGDCIDPRRWDHMRGDSR